jgi:hypothetical protein
LVVFSDFSRVRARVRVRVKARVRVRVGVGVRDKVRVRGEVIFGNILYSPCGWGCWPCIQFTFTQ